MMIALKCIAIDDEPLALELIKNYAEKIPGLQLIRCFDDAISGAEYLRSNEIDLLFIDINMPDISGIDLVKFLPNKPLVIFTTAYKQFAYEGFELEAVDYLLKPINFSRFSKASQKAIELYNHKKSPNLTNKEGFIYVSSEYKQIKIEFDQIEFIESMEDYAYIHFTNKNMVSTLMPLKKMMEKLPEDRFMRIHRSFIVALSKIKSIKNKKISVAEKELPISDSYAETVKQWLLKNKS